MFLILLHDTVFYTANSLSLITNTLVLYFILSEKSKELFEYKSILFFNCIVDYVYLFVQVVNNPRFETVDDLYVQILGDLLVECPHNVQTTFAGLYAYMISLNTLTPIIQSVHRYKLICKKNPLTKCGFIKLIILICLFAVYYWITYQLFLIASNKMPIDLKQLQKNEYIFGSTNASVDRVLVAKFNHWTSRIFFYGTGTGPSLIFLTILVFNWRTYTELKHVQSGMSKATRRLHTELNRLLFAQTFVIFSTTLTPQLAFATGWSFSLQFDGAGTLISMSMICIPCVNSVCTLLLVKRYRERLFNLFKRKGRDRVGSGFVNELE